MELVLRVVWLMGNIGAEETGQRIANLAGSPVLVEYDRVTWYGNYFMSKS